MGVGVWQKVRDAESSSNETVRKIYHALLKSLEKKVGEKSENFEQKEKVC